MTVHQVRGDSSPFEHVFVGEVTPETNVFDHVPDLVM